MSKEELIQIQNFFTSKDKKRKKNLVNKISGTLLFMINSVISKKKKFELTEQNL